MTMTEWLKAQKTLGILAAQQGCSVAQIRLSIQECIDVAWNNAWTTDDVEAQAHWKQLFPSGKKPTVEQFIVTMAQRLTTGENPPYLRK